MVFLFKRVLEKWAEHTGGIEVDRITQQNISDYLLYLRTEYFPRRFGGDTRTLSSKTLRNIYITLARGYHRVFTCACGTGAGKLARTIADSAGSDQIQTPHVAETKQYRLKIGWNNLYATG